MAKFALTLINFFAFYGVRNCITVSDYGALQLKRRYGKDSVVIRGGIFETKGDTDDSKVLSHFGLEKNQYYLTISRIDPVKELETLIRAFMMHPRTDTIKLVIAGDDSNSYGQSLIELAKDDKRVVFTGPVFGNDKELLLKNAMAYCLISQSEGFPIALLEAMSYGNICLVSDIPAIHEALPQNLGLWSEVGRVDDVFFNMQQLEKNAIDIGYNKKQIKEHVLRNFTWGKSADQFVNYIKNLKYNI